MTSDVIAGAGGEESADLVHYLQSSEAKDIPASVLPMFYDRMRRDRERTIVELALISGGWHVSYAQYLADVALNVRLEFESWRNRALIAEARLQDIADGLPPQ